MSNYELLSPAGSPEILREVIMAGADAVYIGGDRFGARAFARNFSQEDVLEALDFAHLRERKVFLTVNTLLKNIEIQRELYDYMMPFYKHGLDAIIVQDYGVFQFVRKYFPELPVHCSTQMSVADHYGAQWLKEQGAARVVTARELSLSEIRNIYDHTHMEIESFVHGALCYCYSGQCLMSSLIGGRSGNRGRCAQPCRLPYQVQTAAGKVIHGNEKYPLSPKDLCTIELLPDICKAGVYSFKIEGRMKQLEYAAGVTEVYRKYIDLYEEDPSQYKVTRSDMDKLLALGNRNGFTKGYYVMHNGPSMITKTESSHNSEDRSKVYERKELCKIPIYSTAYMEPGLESSFTVLSDLFPEIAVSVTGPSVAEALKKPMTEGDIAKQLSKTGDTPFVMTDCDVIVNGDCFIPNKQLNELRREAVEQFQSQILQSYKRDTGDLPTPEFQTRGKWSHELTPFLHVVVANEEQLNEALKFSEVTMISLDFTDHLKQNLQLIRKSGKQAGIFMPYVFRMDSVSRFQQDALADILPEFDRVWARSFDSLGYLLSLPGLKRKHIAIDQGLYAFSDESIEGFSKQICDHVPFTIPFELNRKELRHLNTADGELVLYGHQPLMISAQCVYKNYDTCMKAVSENANREFYIEDRIHNKFLINRRCKDCYNVIYNHKPLSLLHLIREVEELPLASYRLQFTCESAAELNGIMADYKSYVLRKDPADKDYMSYTTGHFHRGVD